MIKKITPIILFSLASSVCLAAGQSGLSSVDKIPKPCVRAVKKAVADHYYDNVDEKRLFENETITVVGWDLSSNPHSIIVGVSTTSPTPSVYQYEVGYNKTPDNTCSVIGFNVQSSAE